MGEGPARRLQSALISVDPRDGAIYAWVGGRDYEKSQFDRVTQAQRQVGSAFKPVIYAAAFAEGMATPATLLKDSPIDVRIGNASWKPQNYDRTFRGWVTARTALEKSLNIPTVRVALQVGMPQVVGARPGDGARRGSCEPRPSLALGAFEVSPFEMAEVYSTLAAGGMRPPVHGLAAVLDRDGEAVTGDELPAPRRALPAESAYLVTSMLQGVLDHGTAAAARRRGWTARSPARPAPPTTAATTGSPATRRTASRWSGWATTTTRRRPSRAPGRRCRSGAASPPPSARPRGTPTSRAPPGMVKATIDPTTGQLATPLCPYRVTDLFPQWSAPTEPCERHSPGATQTADIALGQPLIDPDTGQRIDPAAAEEPRYAITDDGLLISNPGGDQPITISPAAQPGQPGQPGQPAAGAPAAPGDAEGAIVIRPARARAEAGEGPKAPASLVPSGPVGMVQGGVVPAGTQSVGRKATPAEEPAAAPADDQGTAEPPPPG